MERHVGEIDMHPFQQKHTLIFCFLALCLVEGEKEPKDPGGGASQKHTQSRTRGKFICGGREERRPKWSKA